MWVGLYTTRGDFDFSLCSAYILMHFYNAVTNDHGLECLRCLGEVTRHKLDIRGCVHHNIIYGNDQQDATVQDNLSFLGCSTCFERYFRSSSGASKLYLQLLVLFTYVAAGWRYGWGGTEFHLSHVINRQQHTCVILEAVNTVKMFLMMSENIARNM